MRIVSRCVAFAVLAVASALAMSGCGGGSSGGGSPTPPANGVVTVYPGTATVTANPLGLVQFTAFLASQPTATFTWSVAGGASNGSISASTGVYTPPASVPDPATVTITATDTAATSEIGTATITIEAGQTFVLTPAAVTVAAGGPQTFAVATSTAEPIPALAWSVNGILGGNASVGTITSGGVYSAPLTPPSGGAVTITAAGAGVSLNSAATIVFSDASLSGSYAFSYSGGDSSGNPIAAAGSFTTNPTTGGISGIEDYNSDGNTTVALALPVSGSYQVNPDGSGSAILNNVATINGTEGWQFTLGAGISGGASHHALLVRFDTSATGSGAMDLQNTAELNSLSSISGNYVFGISGVDNSGNLEPVQFAGIFYADGAGNIPVNYAEQDINDAGNATANGPDLSLHGTYQLDTGNPGSGRGYLTLTSTNAVYPSCNCQFAFYMVDSTHLKLVQIGTNNAELLSGDAYAAPNTARGSYGLASLSGNYAFTLGGEDLSNGNALAQGGVFTSNGSGGITGGAVDTNDGGTARLNQSVTSSAYAIDTSLGRIALPLTYGNNTTNYAAYVGSNGLLELISLQDNFLDSGNGYLQTSTAAPQGAFALNLSGIVNSSGGFEQDVAGQMTVPASSSPTGNLFINSSGQLAAGTPLGASSSVVAPVSNGRGTASIASHLATYPVVYYMIDGNTVLLFESDGSRTMTGVLSRQY